MVQKPSTPKGTRDFSPTEVARRQYLIGVIRKHFEIFGFAPIETPSFENYQTLMGKYGEEGDRLIFKILNSGDFLSKAPAALLQSADSQKLTPHISDKALRYDLTVPFARYVVQHQNEMTFPFKRYQIQPVWRADRPQKGRFREFYQCDADVIGSGSLWQEVELIQLYDAVFSELGLKQTAIKINNRKILSGIASVIGAEDKLIDFTVALDKLDKIGPEGVKDEMRTKGISEAAIEKLDGLLKLSGSFETQLSQLESLIGETTEGAKGIEELRFICEKVQENGLLQSVLLLDITLARGLNYYTGAIFEVVADGVAMGSIGGGGRYDDLTGIFGLKNMSGVGISFGLDRIYLVMEQLELFSETIVNRPKVLFLNNAFAAASFDALTMLRRLGVAAEMYPEAAKMGKQYQYAEKRAIDFVAEAQEDGRFTLKDILSGEKQTVSKEHLAVQLR